MRKALSLSRENPFGMNTRGAKVAVAILVCIFVPILAACAKEGSTGGAPEDTEKQQAAEDTLEPAEATIGPEENSNMVPAGGKKPDPAQPPPENPPRGVETFPATTNRIVEGDVEYERRPPTNGDHAPLWQNCGFYAESIRDENAVHSLDHGAVWVTYRKELPEDQLDTLRR